MMEGWYEPLYYLISGVAFTLVWLFFLSGEPNDDGADDGDTSYDKV